MTSPTPAPGAQPPPMPFPSGAIRLAGSGLVLREWAEADLDVMAAVFDNPEVDRFTPLPSPFDHAAAVDRYTRARADRAAGQRLCLAITEASAADPEVPGGPPVGEVLVFHDKHFPGGAEMGYGIGTAYRGRGFASRSLRLMVDFAYGTLGFERVVLRIVQDNHASNAVAKATGFVPDGNEPIIEMTKGREHVLTTWVHQRV
ncbi:GNAT family N-acetyltransferase [Yinghuangia soli]|uniref:GNAT family N-acetyltransferase n=1 Tax=Yinghuangia soli TaxID=2908204 RepID=A0AA41PX91_9ACTN|nr:GNAT family N-acetyltransferase [Yinghuangia soli]MCF2527573.1 GNAT family N-acetyltransferase [Yinghuangia soli]